MHSSVTMHATGLFLETNIYNCIVDCGKNQSLNVSSNLSLFVNLMLNFENKLGLSWGSTRLRQLAWSYQTRLNILFITVFNIGLNIELHIWLNIGFKIGLSIGVNIGFNIRFNIWFPYWVQNCVQDWAQY